MCVRKDSEWKISKTFIGNRTRDVSAFSAMPPTKLRALKTRRSKKALWCQIILQSSCQFDCRWCVQCDKVGPIDRNRMEKIHLQHLLRNELYACGRSEVFQASCSVVSGGRTEYSHKQERVMDDKVLIRSRFHADAITGTTPIRNRWKWNMRTGKTRNTETPRT
jgi:hypothetical protein